jgi:phosphotriesterase-related protein
MADENGSILTVEGPIDPDELGVTLPHEHVFADWNADKFTEPDSAVERRLARQEMSMDNQWRVRKDPVSNRDNLRLDSFEDAVEELVRYRRAGGDAIVDVTPKNVGGDPQRVRGIARETGVTIVHGTAFYMRSSHPPRIDEMSRDDIAEEFVSDVRTGIDDTTVRAGVIGEIGVTDTAEGDDGGIDGEFHDAELKVLRAGVDAALRTGVSLSIHPPFRRTEEYPTSRRCLEILDIIEKEGLAPDRVVFCHRDQSKWLESDLTYQKKLAERGAYVEFDLFGHPESPRPTYDDAQPGDTDRIKWIREMIAEGYDSRLLLSHDVFLKRCLVKYGGDGYHYIVSTILPALREYGVAQADLETVVERNPRDVLTLAEPET